ncbi:DUF4097 family beta strand repeat-containing protein [Gracilimonas sp. BCB1]|uniref:DUF4097 family beta strand repeat-containing protein n=1 Tax=Gracilimonas sp. BCB1 TaxID=3152362 RepID=UPI0032D9AAA2
MSSTGKYLNKLMLSGALVAGLFLATAQSVFAQSSDEAYRVEEFDVSGQVSLEVRTSGGSISVLGSNEDEVVVEMYVRKRGDYVEPGEADLDDYEIEIAQDGNKVRAIVERRSGGWNWNNNGYSISFVVYAPEETRTRLKTSGGSLTVRNLSGSQELKTSGGSITTEGIRGTMVLKTSGGSINMREVQGDVEANTSGGTIRAETLVGNLDAKTSGGSIRLAGIEGNVEAKTSGGSINAEILAPSDYIELKTSGGSITIRVPQENGYNLDLDGNRVYVDLNNFSGQAEKDEISGTMNGGGTLIEAKTSGGSVRLEYL